MLIHVGQDRTAAVDLKLAIWLSLVAGAVNAASFRSLGYFSANMTGNLSSLSDFLALGQGRLALGFAVLIAGFMLGAFVSGLLIEVGRRMRVRGIYSLSILLEGGLLAVLAVLDLAWPGLTGPAALMVGLSFVMGLQNGASTRISDGRVRTTHVSGIATDIGLGAAQLLAGGAGELRRVLTARLLLHVSTLAAFFAGGLLGVWGYGALGAVIYAVIALLLFAIALPGLKRARAG